MRHFKQVTMCSGVWISAALWISGGARHAWAQPNATPAASVAASNAAPNPAAAPIPAAAATPVSILEVPAGKGQARLRVERLWGEVRVLVCRGACAQATAAEFELPGLVAGADATTRAVALDLGGGRRAAHVQIEAGDQRWELVATAPLKGDVPGIAFAGLSGLSQGEEPDRTGTRVQIFAKDRGEHDVVIGQLREDVALCGREALLAPELLYPKDLELHRVKLQRLSEAERAAAPELLAAPGAGKGTQPLLTTLVASSAVGDPSGITDGDAHSYWAEGRGGDGSGEFVVLRARRGVELTGFELKLRPNLTEQGALVAPSSFWLVTDDKAYKVKVPSDPWLDSVPDYTVTLPEPIQTGCVGVVLDTAFGNVKDAQVAVAEITATTSVDAARIERAILDLEGPEETAMAAAALLEALGGAVVPAVEQRFSGFSPTARMRALNVYDGAPCDVAAAAYVSALTSAGSGQGPVATDDQAEQNHVVRRLQQCGKPAIDALLAAIPNARRGDMLTLLTRTLAELAPVDAVDAFVPMLGRASQSKRRVLRAALHVAVTWPTTHARVAALLQDASLNAVAKIDLLRALGSQLDKFEAVAAPVIQQALTKPDFRTRYTLLGPLAQLVVRRPDLVPSLVRLVVSDEQPAVRAEAARVAPPIPALVNPLIRAANDPEPRVRESAITNLGGQRTEAARTVLQRRLQDDKWPFVRSASVRALGALAPEPETTSSLARVLERDPSPHVRRPAVLALGKLAALDKLEVLRTTYELDVDANVRAAAAATLGQLCDASMLKLMTERAVKLANLAGSEDELIVAKASLGALGRLAPPDLKERLAPFAARTTPALSRAAAQAALNYSDVCRPKVATK